MGGERLSHYSVDWDACRVGLSGVACSVGYTVLPMSRMTLHQRRSVSSPDGEQSLQFERQQEVMDILKQVHTHVEWTFQRTHAASKRETESLLRGARELESNHAKVDDWRGFVEWSVGAIQASVDLSETLKKHLEEAVSNGWISRDSQTKWMKRFADESVDYKQKEYWIVHQLPTYLDSWKQQSAERKEVVSQKDFACAIDFNPQLAILKSPQSFLALHFDQRAHVIAEAKATMLALKQNRTQLFQDAKGKLSAAAGRKVLADAKVGVWLQRIFESKARAKLIQDFVEGRGTNSLDVLIQRWAEIKQRFDDARSELASRNEETNARGLTIMSEDAFLHMHYDQRVRYVAELEGRLLEAKDIDRAHPTMLKLGYAMDVGDWDDAAELHAEAMLDPTIRPPDRERLKRMERTIRAHLPSKEAQSVEVSNEAARSGMDRALLRMKKTHPECYPLAMQLAKSLHPNRALRQWRQTVYNNIWTRTHGPPYFNDDVARYGASQDAQETTQFLAEHGQDTGMHDSLGAMNADESNIRKKTIQGEKKSKFRPTYLHCDMQSDDVRDTLRKFYEQEQHPALLYWTTFCPHMDHEPMNEERIRELFLLATELRRHSRVLENRGLLYQGIGKPLVKRGATRTTVQSSPSESTWATAG